eukprot:1467686-Amphidinium_carterae.1
MIAERKDFRPYWLLFKSSQLQKMWVSLEESWVDIGILNDMASPLPKSPACSRFAFPSKEQTEILAPNACEV